MFHHNASVWRAIATAKAAEENAGRAFAPAVRPDGLSVWIRKHAYVSTHERACSVCRCLPVTLRLCLSTSRRAGGVRKLKRITNGDCWIAVAHGSSQVQRDERNVARAAAVH